MSIMQSLCEYLRGYPKLADQRLDIDCLGTAAESCSVDAVPCESIVKRYLDGSCVRRILFTLSSRMYYGQDLQQQAENAAFFEGFEDWLELQLRMGFTPDLGAKKTVRSMSVLSSAYPIVIDGDDGTARYQIQCEMIYLQEV